MTTESRPTYRREELGDFIAGSNGDAVVEFGPTMPHPDSQKNTTEPETRQVSTGINGTHFRPWHQTFKYEVPDKITG